MNKKTADIIIAEPSQIIFEGISNILSNAGQSFTIHHAENLDELQHLNIRKKADLVIVNPILLQNQNKDSLSLKKELNNTYWVGIIYSLVDQQVLSMFDELIFINDAPKKIIKAITKLLFSTPQPENLHPQQETLSEREISVLKLLVSGNANKEIADKLNISTNTVISHRKNISQKTGIKTVSGLTIYAVVNHIITIDDYRE